MNALQQKCVYVVGAGFSVGLGYPLTSDLLLKLWNRIKDDGSFRKALQDVIGFHHPRFDPRIFSSFPNVEELLSQMLVNEQLFDSSRHYTGKFTKNHLRNLQRKLLLEISDWFHAISRKVCPSDPAVPWLIAFRERIKRERAVIISFNWDLILDELLFGSELNKTCYGFSDEPNAGPTLLKPHGSLNWFGNDLGRFLKDERKIVLFGEKEESRVYAFRKFRAPVSNKSNREYTPLIVPPVYLKNFGKPVFQALWKNCTRHLSTARQIVFLGYSLPSADFHAQFIMRCGFHNQKEGQLDKNDKRKESTGPAEVVIINPDIGAARRIEAIAGSNCTCRWISTPVGDVQWNHPLLGLDSLN